MSDTVAQVDRPDWTLLERTCRIWTEDDATVGLPDHETLAAAFKRIYKVPMPDCLERYDDGESVYKRLPAHLVTCESYPGNWAIAAWPILFIGDRITVVLKWSSSVKTDKCPLLKSFSMCPTSRGPFPGGLLEDARFIGFKRLAPRL